MRCFVWGSSKEGQLGLPGGAAAAAPTAVEHDGEQLVGVACGEAHTLFLTEFGEVLSCGRAREGQLGREGGGGAPGSGSGPRRVAGALEGEVVAGISCGAFHSVACTAAAGRVFEWGLCCTTAARGTARDEAALGGAAPAEELRPRSNDAVLRRIVEASTVRYLVGDAQPAPSVGDGAVLPGRCSEAEREAIMGLARMDVHRAPVRLPRLATSLAAVRIVDVSAGYGHNLARGQHGELFASGYNDRGQCGLGHRVNMEHFERVKAFAGHVVECARAGGQHSLVVARAAAADGAGPAPRKLYAFGQGALGQLGLGRKVSGRLFPVAVVFYEGGAAVDVDVETCSGGAHHSVAVDAAGGCWFFGHAEYGQHGALGHADYVDAAYFCVPRRIDVAGLRAVACGSNFAAAVDAQGAVVTWGWPAHGVLGHGVGHFSTAPAAVAALGGAKSGGLEAVAVAAGGRHAAAIVADAADLYAQRYLGLVDDASGDVLLRLEGGGAMRAHAAFLAARSRYWRGLLRAAAADAAADAAGSPARPLEVTLPLAVGGAVLTPQMLRSVLVFIYADRVEAPPHRLRELAAVARAWCLPDFAAHCDRRDFFAGAAGAPVAPPAPPPSRFAADLAALADGAPGPGADAVVDVGGIAHHLHRVVLEKYEYFAAAMRFRELQSEQCAGGAPRLALDSAVLPAEAKNILRFVYGGPEALRGEDDPNGLMRLIVAADLLHLPLLVRVCECALVKCIGGDADNARAVLDFTDHFVSNCCQRLRRAASDVAAAR
ncbi:regulator of chromosome condensation 1/beta-lactamase-inhibitor protein II [Pelagophyceae sp. CCMP2097]|nr:regulator of chromosome condensation 1/beta-lactamase-inhibitor protein II [Pelagophyceae sp. CCMP2097]